MDLEQEKHPFQRLNPLKTQQHLLIENFSLKLFHFHKRLFYRNIHVLTLFNYIN